MKHLSVKKSIWQILVYKSNILSASSPVLSGVRDADNQNQVFSINRDTEWSAFSLIYEFFLCQPIFQTDMIEPKLLHW